MAKNEASAEVSNLWQGLNNHEGKEASDAFAILKPYLEPTIGPLIGAKTVQILLLRETLDYVVLRTEETREINEVVTPSARSSQSEIRRVAFLGGKQKAVESRELERLLRECWKVLPVSDAQAAVSSILVQPTKKEEKDKQEKTIQALQSGWEAQKAVQNGKDCYLKDDLCLRCPRCGLFGATSTESGKGKEPNIKHRVEYSTAFSLLPYEEVVEEVTFNAINDDKQITGQALGTRPCVRPGTLFASIVTLKSATPHELMLVLKVLLSARSYGAESRTAGDLRNHVVGIVGGWEEVLTPLEFTLECDQRLDKIVKDHDRPKAIDEGVSTYWNLCAHPSKVLLWNSTDQDQARKLKIKEGLPDVLKAVREYTIDRRFLERAYQDVAALRTAQGA
jgi:CRISPR-associated protein Csc2